MRSKINSLDELLEKAKEEKGWIYATTTDGIKLDYWNPETIESNIEWIKKSQKRLLELRIFSEMVEYKAFRGDIGQGLRFRMIADTNDENEENYFDEEQYLDINTKKDAHDEYPYEKTTGVWKVRTTTGGGPYTVPVTEIENATIIIRNYLDYYEDSGQAYVYDYRLVKFGNKNTNIKERKSNGEG